MSKWTCAAIGLDGNVWATVTTYAETEAEARAQLAWCGIENYMSLVEVVEDE